MTDTFNVFDAAPAAPQAEADRRRQHAERDALVAALGHPAGRGWLEAMCAREWSRPSYVPGDDFAGTAYREGRKAVWREIAEALARASTPTGA